MFSLNGAPTFAVDFKISNNLNYQGDWSDVF